MKSLKYLDLGENFGKLQNYPIGLIGNDDKSYINLEIRYLNLGNVFGKISYLKQKDEQNPWGYGERKSYLPNSLIELYYPDIQKYANYKDYQGNIRSRSKYEKIMSSKDMTEESMTINHLYNFDLSKEDFEKLANKKLPHYEIARQIKIIQKKTQEEVKLMF